MQMMIHITIVSMLQAVICTAPYFLYIGMLQPYEVAVSSNRYFITVTFREHKLGLAQVER